MATDSDTADLVRRRLHQIRGAPEAQLGNRVVSEGLRQMNLPGQYARGVLAGKPGEKATSEEMLGRPLGPIGNLAWDTATDPLTYLGPGLVKAGVKGADLLRAGGAALGEGPAANPLVNAMHRFGREEGGAIGLPFDVPTEPPRGLARTDPEWVNQKTFYHGSGTPALSARAIDPRQTSPTSLYGRGLYKTADPRMAETYKKLAEKGLRPGGAPTVYEAQPAFGRVLDLEGPMTPELTALFQNYRDTHDAQLMGLRDIRGMKTETPNLERLSVGRSGMLDPRFFQDASLFHTPGTAIERVIKQMQLRNDPYLVNFANLKEISKKLAKAGATLPDPTLDLIRALKGGGYDALTHTGGLRAGGGERLHQVVIGLDPNDVLGMGRATPYQVWRPAE